MEIVTGEHEEPLFPPKKVWLIILMKHQISSLVSQMVKMAQSLIHFAIIKSIQSELRELP